MIVNKEKRSNYSNMSIGQLDTVKYPYGFAIRHFYDNGRLKTIRRVGNNTGLVYNTHNYSFWNTPILSEYGNLTGTILIIQ